MKEKILAELKKKYAGQLTTKFMESLSERLAAKVTEETQIEGAIAELENSPIKITDLQSEGDRRATEIQNRLQTTKAEMQAELDELKKKPGLEPPKDKDDQYKLLEERLAAFEQKEKERELRGSLAERAKAKNIPPALYKNILIKSAEEIDQVVSDLEREAQEIKQSWINDGVVGEKPSKSDGGAGTDEQIKADIVQYSAKIK